MPATGTGPVCCTASHKRFSTGKVLTEPIGTALAAGRFARVPVLNGTNHDEERIFVSIGLTVSQGTDVPIPETPVTPGNYQANIVAALGVTAAQIAAEYPPGNDKASATVAFSALAGDASFACPALRIDQQTSQRVPAYAYEFKRRQRAADLHRAAVPTARGDARVRAPVPVRPAQRAAPCPA
jgi:carboxylesterase type B